MAVVIRFTLLGKKKQPVYRIIATEKSNKRNGKYLDCLGYYNPHLKSETFVLDHKKYEDWLKKGAKPSVGLLKILKQENSKKIN